MRRGLLVPVGVLLGFLTGSLVLVVGAAVLVAGAPPQTSRAMLDAAAWVFAAQPGRAPGPLAMQVGVAIWWTLITACLVPIGVVAVLGEVTRRRGRLALSGATGLLAVLGPLAWIAGLDAGRAVALEGSGRVLALLFLSGVASGWTYWLVAGSGGPTRPAQQ